MYKLIRKRLAILLALVLAVCVAVIGLRAIDCQKADTLYAEAERLVTLPEIPAPTSEAPVIVKPDTSDHEENVSGINLSPLQAVNQDVVGWIEIPGVLSYPILQGQDNAYYLSHAWNREENAAGAVFLDYRASNDFSDFHTMIYGHRMRNGTMFGSLKNYADAAFWQSHPCIYITDASGTHQYDVFAAYEVSVTAIVYQHDLSAAEEQQNLIQFALEQSAVETSVMPAMEDSIITLSTCTGGGHNRRWVVQAVLTGVL